MPLTPPPTPPNSGDPGPFNDRMDAMLGWFPGFVSELNEALPDIGSSAWTKGSNANGVYMRHSSGFQFCARTITGIAITEQTASGVYRNPSPFSWTFPAAFVVTGASGAFVSGRILTFGSGLSVNVPYGNRTTEAIDIRAYALASFASASIELMAIGRWN